MVLIVAIITGLLASLAMVLIHLRKAPIGYEDEAGFHIVQQLKGSAILRYGKSEDAATASLKRAKAH